jgi:hypothetical protein
MPIMSDTTIDVAARVEMAGAARAALDLSVMTPVRHGPTPERGARREPGRSRQGKTVIAPIDPG